jgi:hypothetical protein
LDERGQQTSTLAAKAGERSAVAKRPPSVFILINRLQSQLQPALLLFVTRKKPDVAVTSGFEKLVWIKGQVSQMQRK